MLIFNRWLHLDVFLDLSYFCINPEERVMQKIIEVLLYYLLFQKLLESIIIDQLLNWIKFQYEQHGLLEVGLHVLIYLHVNSMTLCLNG